MSHFADYRSAVGTRTEKYFKTTLFETDRLLLGLNCLEPGQLQSVHSHADQDKFYFVVEGIGEFEVGGESRRAGPGLTVWAPAGVRHGVANRGRDRLVLLVGLAPRGTA